MSPRPAARHLPAHEQRPPFEFLDDRRDERLDRALRSFRSCVGITVVHV
jgi:hypothetical protein